MRASSPAAAAGLAPVAAVSLAPLLGPWASKAAVLLVMGLALAARVWLDRGQEPRPLRLTLLLAILAALLVACHWLVVDTNEYAADWQRTTYRDILNRTAEPPHVFRALPYGFTRSLELLTGDWLFACVLYRWFFTYWFLWAWHRFARLFHEPPQALLAVLPVLVFYPLSILFYLGQLTDPMSHAFFALALVYIVTDRWLLLGAVLALGIWAKETAVVLVPAYCACWWRSGWPAWARTAVLGAVAVAAYFAARVSVGGWQLDHNSINGTTGWMVGTNLGIGEPLYHAAAPLYQNYLQPLLFIGIFVPLVAWRWQSLDGRLRALILTLVPLVFVSNLCFGWLYESRNYMPLLPLLTTAALPVRRPSSE